MSRHLRVDSLHRTRGSIWSRAGCWALKSPFAASTCGALVALHAVAGTRLDQAPTITTQPKHVTAPAGRESVLSVGGYGSSPLRFQWLQNGKLLEGANEPVLRLAELASTKTGDYQVVLFNDYGRSTSDVARVTDTKDSGWSPAGGVFSCNAVGYINLHLAPGFTLVANQLSNVDTNGLAPVSRVLGQLPNGLVLHHVTPGGFSANAYLHGWRDPQSPLPFGDVFFVFNPYASEVTVTFVGAVVTGELQQSLPAGFSVAGSLVPQEAGVESGLSLPVVAGDEVWRWNSQTQAYSQFKYRDDGWQPAEPVVAVGEAFVAKKQTETIWRRVFHLFAFDPCGPNPGSGLLQRTQMSPSEGQVHLFTYHPDPSFGRVEGAGNDYLGQLYAGLSTNENDLLPVGVPVRFLDGDRAGYLDGGLVTIPGLPAGQEVHVQLRAWCGFNGFTYEEAQAAGCLTVRSEIVVARTAAPEINGRPGMPPRPVNQFRSLRFPTVPGIAIQPEQLAFETGQSATMTVTGLQTEAVGFQWRRNGEPVPGAASGGELRMQDLQPDDSGDYSVLVTNTDCVLSSTSVRLIVYRNIAIQAQPANVDCIAGSSPQFSVAATGEPPLTYQWRSSARDAGTSNRLSRATNATLVLYNVVDECEGDYWVEIRSAYETVESARARLTVSNELHLALETPSWEYTTGGDQSWRRELASYLGRSHTATVGPLPAQQTAWMETQVEGPGVVSFWWARTSMDGISLRFLIDGQIKESLYSAPDWKEVSVPVPAGTHRLRWQFDNYDAVLLPVRAWVDSVSTRPGVPPTILSASSNFWFMPDDTVVLSVSASGEAPLHYQWFMGTNRIPWSAGDTLRLLPWWLTDGESYSVTVSNFFGVASSAPMIAHGSPRLQIESDGGGLIRLSWPRGASGFVLEQNSSLAEPWSVVPQTPNYSETSCFAILPSEAATNRWFRLRLP